MCTLLLVLKIPLIMEVTWSAPFIPTPFTNDVSCICNTGRLSCHTFYSFPGFLKLLRVLVFNVCMLKLTLWAVRFYELFQKHNVVHHTYRSFRMVSCPSVQIPMIRLFSFSTLPLHP